MIAGIQLSSIKAQMQTEKDVQTSLSRLAMQGYTTVQLQWHSKELPVQFLADTLKINGMKAVSVQDYTHEILSDMAYYVRLADACGFTDICISGIPAEQLSINGISDFSHSLNSISDRLKAEGKHLSFHPRWQELGKLDGETILFRLLDKCPDLRVVSDIHHVARAGLSPAEHLLHLAGRVDYIHCKELLLDMPRKLVPLGQGCIDWAEVFRAAQICNVKVAFAEQEGHEGDPFDDMDNNLQYMLSRGL